MRRIFLVLLAAIASLNVGCAPQASEAELGKIVYELPEVPGAKEPYLLPAATEGAAAEKPEHDHPHPH